MASFTLDQVTGTEITLDDIKVAPVGEPLKAGESSRKIHSTNVALLADDTELVTQQATTINQEHQTEGGSATEQAIVDESFRNTQDLFKQGAEDVLLDPEVDDNTKRAAVDLAFAETSAMFGVKPQLMTKELSKELELTTPDIEETRLRFGDLIDTVVTAKEEQQHVLNRHVASADASTMSALHDFTEAVLPFVKQDSVAGILQDINDLMGNDQWDITANSKALFAMGEAMEDIQNTLKSVPIEDRHVLSEALANIIDNNSSILMSGENDFLRVDELRSLLEDGYYGEGSKWIDNVVSILDIVGLGTTFKSVAKGAPKSTPNYQKDMGDIVKRGVIDRTSPVAPAKVVEGANPDTARIMFEQASTTDDAAVALYGANKTDVVAKELSPDVIMSNGVMTPRVTNLTKKTDLKLSGDAEALDFIKQDGSIYYTAEQKRAMRSNVVMDFSVAKGLRLRENVMQVGRDDSDGISIRAVYSASEDAGWGSIQDVIEQTSFNLRKYGINENDITVLERTDKGWEQVKQGSTGGEYIARVDFDYSFNPLDVVEWDTRSVNYNMFDRTIGQVKASVSNNIPLVRYMKDAASTFDPKTSLGALRAADRSASIEKRLVEQIKDFDESILSLPKESQIKMHEFIKEANHNGLSYDPEALFSNGFNRNEVDALQKWKGYWDTNYILENGDLTRTLNAKGWELFAKGDSNLIVRPVARNQKPSTDKFYDTSLGEIRVFNKTELDELYEGGGSIMQLRTPHIDESLGEITHVVVKQNASDYSRAVREEDHVLNYREGYYAVKYKAPIFIDRTVNKGKVNEYKETVSYVGTSKEADLEIRRLQEQDPDSIYVPRDNRSIDKTIEDDYIEVSINQGRSSQKFRGKRLRDATATNHVDEQFIMDPVESMIHSARSISQRVAFRDYLEATKQQFLDQYADVLPVSKGSAQYPKSINEFPALADKRNSKMLQDARGTWEYINYLENGYVNTLDESIKGSLRRFAEITGKISSRGESALLKVSDIGITSMGKNLAFQAYLATNPLRQLIVQSHQMVQLAAIDPIYAATRLPIEASAMMTYKMGNKNVAAKAFGVSRKEMDQIMNAFDASGLSANVDRHAMLVGAMTQMVDTWSYGSKTKRVAGSIASAPRRIGFDSGELANVATAWLAMRNEAIKAGKDVTRVDVNADVSARARDFTYGMNMAGDMPYNQNSLGMLLQFMQVPHKSWLQMTGNRVLTPKQKGQVAAFNLAMYSAPPAVMYGAMGGLLEKIENEEVRDAVVFGLETYMINAMLNTITDEDSQIDFSGLAPTDMYGFYETLTTIMTDGLGEAWANSPSTSLMFGANPRLANAWKGAARYFHVIDDGVEAPEDFWEVMKGVFSISSGYSATMRANLAMETGKKMSSSGRLSEITKGESIALYAGFGTQDEVQSRVSRIDTYWESPEYEADFHQWYGDMKRVLASKEIPNEDQMFRERMMNAYLRHFKQAPQRFNQLLMQRLKSDAKQGDYKILEGARRNMGVMTNQEFKAWIISAPIPEDIRRELIDTMDVMTEINKDK